MNQPKNTVKRTKKVQEDTAVSEPIVEVKSEPIVPKQIDIDDYVTVCNGHHGHLIYKSKRTGETFVWEEYGDEQEIQIRELKDAKNSNKKFFVNNWFVFKEEDQWIIDYLGMRNFYRNSIGLGRFDELFSKTPDEIIAEIANMSKGQKDAVSHRARQLVIDGEIDSRKCIAALEESLGIELIEK